MVTDVLRLLWGLALLAAPGDALAETFNRFIDGDTITPDGLSVDMRDGLAMAVVEVRGAVSDNRECHGESKAWWGVGWRNNASDSVTVKVGWGNSAYATDYDVRYLRLSMLRNDSLLWSSELVKDVDLLRGDNSVSLSFTSDGTLSVDIGDRYLHRVASNVDAGGFPRGKVSVAGSDKFRVRRIMIREDVDPKPALLTAWTSDSVMDYLASSNDPLEAVWEYLDRDNDASLAVMGGRYIFATVKNGRGYDLIYLSGASTMSHLWTPGMKKGELTPTIFINDFNLVWYDSLMERMGCDDEISASVTDGSILTLRFPLLSTQLRFSRMRLR